MSAPPVTLDHYQLRLPVFEGPLDVLLRLIERDQLAITDLSLVAVTDSFLAYLADLGDAPANLVAEFAAVAGRLLVLKSRSLLPRPPDDAEEPLAGDLARQLAEHRVIRDAAVVLGQLDRLALAAYPGGEAVVRPSVVAHRLAVHPPTSLRKALLRRLALAVPVPPVPTPHRAVSIGEMILRFLDWLRPNRRLTFSRLVGPADNRLDMLVAFLALLILVRVRAVEATQDELFGEIDITLGDHVDLDAVRRLATAHEATLA